VDLSRTGTINNFVMDYLGRERQNLLRNYPTFELFYENFKIEGEFTEQFEAFAEEAGIRRNRIRVQSAESFLNRMVSEMRRDTALRDSETYLEYIENVLWTEERMREFLTELAEREDQIQRQAQESSDRFIMLRVKALLAQNLYGRRYFFKTIRPIDEGYQRALRVIEDDRLFRELNISY
jgi:hypothetical protein